MNSLERRLLVGMGTSALLAFALLLWGGGLAVRQITEGYVRDRLGHDAEGLLAWVEIDADGRPTLPPDRDPPVYQQPLSGHYYLLLGGPGPALRSRSLWDETLPVSPLAPGREAVHRIPGPEGQRLLLLVRGYEKQGHRFTLAVAEDLTPLQAEIHRYQLLSGGTLLAVLLLLLAIQRQLLRRAFGVFETLREEVRRVGRGEIQTLSGAVPLEIRPLVEEFNRLLQLLAQRLERSRNALGNLAHALKTPLSLLSHELQADDRLEPQRRRLLCTQAERIHELVERELHRARIAGGGSPGQWFDSRIEIPPLLEALRRLHADRDLRLEAGRLPEAPIPLDREDMLELLGNLLDNACKWARRRVRLSILSGEATRVVVEDDGPGVEAADLARLTERGTRVDESREGHGLGLSIVRDIVQVYGGTIRFDRAPDLGGLRVSLTLARPAEVPQEAS